MARIERLALALGLDPFDVNTDTELRRRTWGMALGVDLLTDLHPPSYFPERWTTEALLDELERRQEPESRHKLKPTKLAGKSLSELAAEARRRREAMRSLDEACTKHWSRCAPCSPYPSPVCRTHSDMRASFQFPDPRELRLRVSR